MFKKHYIRTTAFLIPFKSILSFLLLLFLGAGSVWAQDDEEQPKPDEKKPVNEVEIIPPFRSSIRAAFKLPNAMSNTAFKKVFNGVSNVEVGYVQPFLKNFFVGAGVQHSYFQINRFSFQEVSSGNLQSITGYGELGFQKYTTDIWYYTISLRAGYSDVTVRCSNCNDLGEKPSEKMAYGEIIGGFFLHGNERMSYGLLLSYQLYNFDFNPSWVCKTGFSGLTQSDWTGISQSLTIGFGFNCILGKIP